MSYRFVSLLVDFQLKPEIRSNIRALEQLGSWEREDSSGLGRFFAGYRARGYRLTGLRAIQILKSIFGYKISYSDYSLMRSLY